MWYVPCERFDGLGRKAASLVEHGGFRFQKKKALLNLFSKI